MNFIDLLVSLSARGLSFGLNVGFGIEYLL